jgi:hypothetical protein
MAGAGNALLPGQSGQLDSDPLTSRVSPAALNRTRGKVFILRKVWKRICDCFI